MSTAIKKRNLEVKTQMSETIWLKPDSERTVFLQIKNTSDKDMSGLQGKIADAVKAKGYQVVTSPDKAYYWKMPVANMPRLCAGCLGRRYEY